MKTPLDKSEFIGLENISWLYCGAESPALKRSADAVQKYFLARSAGPSGRAQNEEMEESLKNNLAKMLHLSPENVAIGANTSALIFSLVLSLDWQPGDNVVIHTLEFPAGVLPCLQLKKRGVEVRVIEHKDWRITPQQILEQVDGRTRLVISSWVSYLSGARLPYQQVYEELKKTNTLFLVDITQALGAFTFDATQADFTVCSSYKWLFGTHGAGILGINPARTKEIVPQIVGWRGISDMFSDTRFEKFTYHTDARRFEMGYPSYPTIWALEASTDYLLEVGVDNCSKHILEIGTYLIEQLSQLGYEIMTPREPDLRAGNIAIVCPRGEEIAAALAEENIFTWGGDNRLRASLHAFVSHADIDQFIEALQRYFPV